MTNVVSKSRYRLSPSQRFVYDPRLALGEIGGTPTAARHGHQPLRVPPTSPPASAVGPSVTVHQPLRVPPTSPPARAVGPIRDRRVIRAAPRVTVRPPAASRPADVSSRPRGRPECHRPPAASRPADVSSRPRGRPDSRPTGYTSRATKGLYVRSY